MAIKYLECFKAYDIRGRVPDQLNPQLAEKTGRAFAAVYGCTKVVVGRDMRLSSGELAAALMAGLVASGCEVLDLGLCGTEEIYHATFSLEKEGVDGGIVVTASHNPADYNGMKFVTKGAKPVTGESGLRKMAELIVGNLLPANASKPGRVVARSLKEDYVDHLLGYLATDKLRPLKIVVNSGNGLAGDIIDRLAPFLPFDFVRLHHQPDGSFPNGVPNPLLPENREETGALVRASGADLGLGWDGDFDRCFFWDENGTFVEGYYIVGLLAEAMLAKAPGATVLYDPRLTWNTEELVKAAGGRAVMTRTGHAFIKERMRAENAAYGGEMSAHHYFRDFGYCDSGMIPWLLVTELMSSKKSSLSSMVAARVARFPVSGEINSTVADPDQVLRLLETSYAAGTSEYVDGVSVSFANWRFNVRQSNTEPLLRLNVESRGDGQLLAEKTEELLRLIRGDEKRSIEGE